MEIKGEATLLRIYTSNTDKFKHNLLYEMVVYAARRYGLAGATVLKGTMGYGSSSVVHSNKFWQSPSSIPSNLSFAKECNFADPLGTNNRNSTFYIVKRDKKYIFGDSILKSMNRIKEVLEEKGIKQKWLAEKLGKSYNMVNGYVQNRQQPKLEILFEIAAILEVNPKDLIKEIK